MTRPERKTVVYLGMVFALGMVLMFWLELQAAPRHWDEGQLRVTTNGWPATISVQVIEPIARTTVESGSYAHFAFNLLFLALGVGPVAFWIRWSLDRPDTPWFSFRLRTLFVVMALCALLLGGWKLAGRLSHHLVQAAIDDVLKI